jgi:hypothetical protein
MVWKTEENTHRKDGVLLMAKKEPVAWLYEEYDVKSGDLKKSYLWSFHPNQLSYLNDLKNTTHHIKITPLFPGEPVEEYKGISKYDSKKLTEAYGGL